jgi:hypothetical protein
MATKQLQRYMYLAVIILAFALGCGAQELTSIDLTNTSPRKELRRPELKGDETAARRSGVHETYECDASRTVPGVLKTTLVLLDQDRYRIGDKPRFEVRIENVGQQVAAIPSLADLVELQPADPAKSSPITEWS